MSYEARQALACNVAAGTGALRHRALCYVVDDGPGSGGEKVKVAARARGGGRWFEHWVPRWRLHNFRVKTVVPEQGLYKRLPARDWTEAEAAAFDRAASEERGARLQKFGPARYGRAQGKPKS